MSKRLARRRTQSGRMKAVVLEPVGRKAFRGWRVARSAEGARSAEANVVEEHDQHVRRPFRRAQRHDRRVFRLGILGVVGCQADMLRIGDWQNVARKFVVRIGHSVRSLRQPDWRSFSNAWLCGDAAVVETDVNNHRIERGRSVSEGRREVCARLGPGARAKAAQGRSVDIAHFRRNGVEVETAAVQQGLRALDAQVLVRQELERLGADELIRNFA